MLVDEVGKTAEAVEAMVLFALVAVLMAVVAAIVVVASHHG